MKKIVKTIQLKIRSSSEAILSSVVDIHNLRMTHTRKMPNTKSNKRKHLKNLTNSVLTAVQKRVCFPLFKFFFYFKIQFRHFLHICGTEQAKHSQN